MPAEERTCSARTLSSEVRTSAGKMTRTGISRSCWRMNEAALPDIAVSTVSAMSLASTPNREARCGSILKVTAGPLTTTPFLVSTTPEIFLMAVSTSSAFSCSAAASSLKSLISIGSGLPCRSPITSGTIPTNSISNAGWLSSICLRRSEITSSVPRLCPGFSLTAKSPRFGSVTNRPISSPVRRE